MSRINPSGSAVQKYSIIEPSEPCTRVELSISCENLADKDIFTKSDPMCVVFMRSITTQPWFEVGRTEEITDNLNPNFATPVIVEYRFEEKQFIRFVLVDIDDRANANLEDQDFLGEYETQLSSILTTPGCRVTHNLKLKGKPHRATITIKAEEVVTSKESFTFQFKAVNLDKKDFFGKSDPYLVISRAREDGSWIPVFKTEVIKKTLNPIWKPFEIACSRLSNGDQFRTIKIDCYDWNFNSEPELIGSMETNQSLLTSSEPDTHWELINAEQKSKKKKYQNSGQLVLISCVTRIKHSFLDYIVGGCEINLMIAIDFTASNGDPRVINSLHYCPPNGMSDYEKAIRAVGEIVSQYDSDGIFPVVGFGARYIDQSTRNHVVSHCLELAPPRTIVGIEQVVQVYKNTLSNITLYGPTNFSQVIRWASTEAGADISQDNLHYTILLILTDGVISDQELTKMEIIAASGLPLSIIIVGIGAADFQEMDELDSDDALLSCHGKVAERDIVQFVPFRDFIHQPYEYLAKVTLAEIPTQLTSYMYSKGFVPPQREPVRRETIKSTNKGGFTL